MLNRTELEIRIRKLRAFVLTIEDYRKDILKHIWHISSQIIEADNQSELAVLQEKYLALSLLELRLKAICKFINRREINPLYLINNDLQIIFANTQELKSMTAEQYINTITDNIVQQIEAESKLPFYKNKDYLLLGILLAVMVCSAVVASLFVLFPYTDTGKLLLVLGVTAFALSTSFFCLGMSENPMSDYKLFLETDGAAIKSFSKVSNYRASANDTPEPAVEIKRVVPGLQGVDTTEFIPERMLPKYEGELTKDIIETRDYVRRVRCSANSTQTSSLYFGKSREVLKQRFFASGESGVTVKSAVYGEIRAQQVVERGAISEHLNAVLHV